jgi:hypothetical protein
MQSTKWLNNRSSREYTFYNRWICKTSKDNESESLKSEKGEGKGNLIWFNLI